MISIKNKNKPFEQSKNIKKNNPKRPKHNKYVLGYFCYRYIT